MRSDVALIVAGGPSGRQYLPPEVGPDWPVIAADSGADLAWSLGITPTLVVGDLDSISAAALTRCRDGGVPIESVPVDKDITDLELALAAARRQDGLQRIVVLGGAGGRLDHLLANISVLCGPATDGLVVEAWPGLTRVLVVRGMLTTTVTPGATVSLLAWQGPATGVTTSGLRWRLDDAVLAAGSALGTSNVAVDEVVSVEVRSGVVSMVIVPIEEVR